MDPWNTQVTPANQGLMSPQIKSILQALLGGGQSYYGGMSGQQSPQSPMPTPNPAASPTPQPNMPSPGGAGAVPGLNGVSNSFNDFLGAIQKRMGG